MSSDYKSKNFYATTPGKNMSWDNPLPTSMRNEYTKIVYNLQNLSKIQIPHYINTKRNGIEEYQLICFCDASEKNLCNSCLHQSN